MPLLPHEKALVISTTLFREEDDKAKLEELMTRIIDVWGLRYPGVKKVGHAYFSRVPVADDATRQQKFDKNSTRLETRRIRLEKS